MLYVMVGHVLWVNNIFRNAFRTYLPFIINTHWTNFKKTVTISVM